MRAGWGRGASRWRMVGKRNSTPLRWLGASLLLTLLVLTIVGNRRGSLMVGQETSYQAQLPGRTGGEGELFRCDRSQFRTDICNMKGDIRVQTYEGNRSNIVLYAQNPSTGYGVEMVKPYTRKWEESCMDTVHQVTLRSVPDSVRNPPPCDVHHKVPAVVFSTGGYTGNLYHEFHDGLIPLFITTQHLNREVVMVISEYHTWWLTKYSELVQQLTKYEVIDLENDTRVHCFPEIEAGLHIHDELSVDPDRMPNHETIRHFRAMLDRGYTPDGAETMTMTMTTTMPRLTIIVRNGTRKLLNLDGIVETAEELGFNVTLLVPDPTMELKHIFKVLNSTDVLLGVHGAAMTHFLFMRPGAVFIQVVPLGTDWAAFTYYGEPAMKLGLHYLPYKIAPAESSLSDRYNATDPVLRNPDEIVRQGWWIMKQIYLDGQDVRPSLSRMRKLLLRALAKLKARQVSQ